MLKPMSVVFFVLLLGLTQCSNGVENPSEAGRRELTEHESQLVSSTNAFGVKLFQEIVKSEEEEKNVFVSPLSVSMALGMTYNGAEGTTEEAMRNVLELGSLSEAEVNEAYKGLIDLLAGLDENVRFDLANSIWCRLGVEFKEPFLDLAREYFDAEVATLDFSSPTAVPTINGWVNEKTNGKISEIVEAPIDAATIMFLINVIYFKGFWTSEFDPEKTVDDMFTLPDGSNKPCRMMMKEGDFMTRSTPDYSAVSLPYGEGDFRMVVILPEGGSGVDELAAKMTGEEWGDLFEGFEESELHLGLPKFTVEYEISLNDVLKHMGMAVAFSGAEADFTGLYEGPERAFISKVKHKTFVAVDERGTEAAAATSVEIGRTSLPPMMIMDRPFLFAIYESHSNTILFIGKLVEPVLE